MKPARSITPWLFLAPALLMFGFAVLLPMVFTVGYSFTDWNGFGAMTFVGLDNYVTAATDPIFRDSFVHVCLYIGATLVLEVLVGLGLAGIVSAVAGRMWFRVAIFTPVMLPMVVVAVLWSFVYNPDFGLVNATLAAVGLEELQRIWLGDPATALAAISVVSGWVYAGFYMMIFYAAFRQIPHEVQEAARLDGAGEWSLFRRIKVPMIRSAVWVGVLLCVTGGFQGFDLFFVLTNGGPYGATEIPTTYLVKTVFRNGEVGYGSAMAVVLTAIVLGVGLLYSRLSRQRAPRPSEDRAVDVVAAGPAVVDRLVVPEQAR
ncbi:MAG TPA: sugar ABC transporter permease [Candidatus Limnocylindrales bacterium]|nr:sugar ABC transporter permease [Candidatus Limnocylindrales bacterium]